jgi:hypothetical protein
MRFFQGHLWLHRTSQDALLWSNRNFRKQRLGKCSICYKQLRVPFHGLRFFNFGSNSTARSWSRERLQCHLLKERRIPWSIYRYRCNPHRIWYSKYHHRKHIRKLQDLPTFSPRRWVHGLHPRLPRNDQRAIYGTASFSPSSITIPARQKSSIHVAITPPSGIDPPNSPSSVDTSTSPQITRTFMCRMLDSHTPSTTHPTSSSKTPPLAPYFPGSGPTIPINQP